MVGDDTMSILTPEGYVYHLQLSKEDGKTLIGGGGWDNLKQHYKIRYDHVMVHMDDATDFLRVNVLNTSDYPKQLTDQPG